jgi:transcription initiation factor IIE alpha subunit
MSRDPHWWEVHGIVAVSQSKHTCPKCGNTFLEYDEGAERQKLKATIAGTKE